MNNAVVSGDNATRLDEPVLGPSAGFAHEKRAYSHGCMRVENPLKYAEVLLSIARPHATSRW